MGAETFRAQGNGGGASVASVALPRVFKGNLSMSESNCPKNAIHHNGFEWAGTVARIRRGGKSMRSGRRSALLSMLTSTYVNTSRTGARSADTRGTSDRA